MFAGILYLAGRRLWCWILEEIIATEIRQGSDIAQLAASVGADLIWTLEIEKLHLALVAQIRIVAMRSHSIVLMWWLLCFYLFLWYFSG